MYQKKLSVIFPVRATENREYIIDNIERITSLCPLNPKIEYILVDSGSITHYSNKISQICKKNKVKYVYQNTKSQVFSAGLARDYGAQIAKGTCILFIDVDIVFDKLFFDKILQEIETRELEVNITDYFCVPCFYLDQEYSAEIVNEGYTNLSRNLYRIKDNYENGNNEGILSFAPCTSLTVINRLHFLSIGGHRTEFSGHGSEDFELTHRLATYSNKYHRPKDYYFERKHYNSIEYIGFRSYFSIPGYSAYKKDLFVAHIWHPRPKDAYRFSNSKNKDQLQRFMKDFDEGKAKIEPLEDLTIEGLTLVFGKRGDKLWLGTKQLLPSFGRLIYMSEHDVELCNIEDMIKRKGITRFVFPNPYGNEQRLSIYNWARKNSFPYLVLERGALPDSWYLDRGFNADSSSYDVKNWNKPLSPNENIKIDEYINGLIQSSVTLESNSNFRGGEITKRLLEKKFNIGNRKILLITLQRPSDTVVKYFSGAAKSYDDFIVTINQVVQGLNEHDWYVIIKKHPLEPGFPSSLKKTGNMLFVDNEYHIHDLLYVSDKVFLLNSGVGLLASLFEKPVIYMGEVFYGHPDLNKHARNASEVVSLLNEDIKVSISVRNQFIHFLKNNFYSYADVYSSERVHKDGSKQTISEYFNFYQIKFPDKEAVHIKYREHPIPIFSRVYGIFLGSILAEERKNSGSFISPVNILENIKSGQLINKTDSKKVNDVFTKKPNSESTEKLNNLSTKKSNNYGLEVSLSKIDKILLKLESTIDTTMRKKRKFKRDPYNFFGDSKNPIINKGKYFYRNKK